MSDSLKLNLRKNLVGFLFICVRTFIDNEYLKDLGLNDSQIEAISLLKKA